jgi:hypothetical protein
VAAAGVQHPDLQHRRPSSQSRFSLCGTAGLAAVAGIRSESCAWHIKPRILTTAINEDDNTASFALGYGSCAVLEEAKAKKIAAEVAKAVSKWRDEAARRGLSKSEIERMSSAFEHDDLKLAQGR